MSKPALAILLALVCAWNARADESPLVVQAEASIKAVKYDVAIDLLNRAIASNPNDSRAYCDRAYAYEGQRNFTSALADCHTAIQLDGNNANAYCVLGNINWIAGHIEDARNDFDEALHLAPGNSVFWFSRGLFYLHGNNTQAIDDFTQALRINPRYEDAYYNRGDAYLDGRQYDNAISDFTAALQLKPNYGNLYHQRGFAYLQSGKLDKAIADYTQAIAFKPQSDAEYYSRGYAYEAAHDYPHAVEDFTAAIQINPKNGACFYQRALAYVQLGNQAQANADLKEVAALKAAAGN